MSVEQCVDKIVSMVQSPQFEETDESQTSCAMRLRRGNLSFRGAPRLG